MRGQQFYNKEVNVKRERGMGKKKKNVLESLTWFAAICSKKKGVVMRSEGK